MTTASKKTKERIHEGLCNVCAHRVSFFYRIPRNTRLTDTLKERLNEEAEERARSQIFEDCIQGELNYETEKFQATGWWEIEI
jgi:hypothetical protein